MKTSSNFKFMEAYWPETAALGETAETALRSDPNACLKKLGALGERLVSKLLAYERIVVVDGTTYAERAQTARRSGLLPQKIDDILYALQKGRDDAAHDAPDCGERAPTLLRMAFRLCVWFMEVYGDWDFQPEEYREPDAESSNESAPRATASDSPSKVAAAPTRASARNADERREKSTRVAESLELSDKETAYLAAERIRVEAVCLPVVNSVILRNGARIVRSVRIDNKSSRDLCDATLRVSSSPAFFDVYQRVVPFIPANNRIEINDLELVVDPNRPIDFSEKTSGVIKLELTSAEGSARAEYVDATLLAFNDWPGARFFPELLAAFVAPDRPGVGEIVARAAELLGERTQDSATDGYQSRDPNRALQQAAAVFDALRELNVAYAESPENFIALGQRVRLCDEVLSQKRGSDLELSLLFASCLEAIGLHPLLILQKGRAFVGLWLEESTFPESVQDDVSLLTKRLAEDARAIAAVDVALCAAGKNATFEAARESAEGLLTSADEFECFVDLRRARLDGVAPLPDRAFAVGEKKAERSERAENDSNPTPNPTPAPAPREFSKKALWERKLLDLGLRNNLLNARITRTTIPILSSSPSELEDALAAGGDFSIHPRPAEWKIEGEKLEFESLRDVEGCSETLQSEFKAGRLRSALTEAELTNALKNLYRAAKSDLEENGANTLYMALGFLKWFETDRSVQPRFAPVLLLPVEMVRKSAAEGYVVRLRDDEAQLNITLLEKLRQDFSIEIRGLDPPPADEKGVDARAVFEAVRRGIASQNRWEVQETACLGIFSFSQFVMWNDIHNRAGDLSRSKVVKSLMEGRLAWQAEDMSFEGMVPEDKALLPISADASQLFAIESAADGKSFVLHGPPGTGKSQTITALIANVLAQGKTVLFVAEKMAALEVVQRRLAKIGLAPFCLELHSNKAKKKDVLEQLRRASEITKYRSSGEFAVSAERIAALRKELNGYATALHRRLKCGKSLFELINEYQTYRGAPDVERFPNEFLSELDENRLYDLSALLDRLVSAGREVGGPCGHPLSSARCKTYSQEFKRVAVENAGEYKKALTALNERARAFADAVGQTVPTSLDEFGRLVSSAQSLLAFEACPPAWSKAENAESLLDRIVSLAGRRNSEAAYRQNLTERWSEEFLSLDGAASLAEYRLQSGKWFLPRFFAMRALRKRFASLAKTEIKNDALGRDLAALVAYQAEKKAGDDLYAESATDLDFLNRAEETDWRKVEDLATGAKNAAAQLSRIDGGAKLRVDFGTDKRVLELARGLSEAWESAGRAKDKLFERLEIRTEEEENWATAQEKICDAVIDREDELRDWVLWNVVASEAEAAGLGSIVTAYRNGLDGDSVKPACEKAIFKGLCVLAIESDQTLNMFSGKDFNGKIAQFGKIDQELMELAKSEIYCRLAARVPNFITASASSSETGVLQRAVRSNGRGTSVRKLFEQIPNLLPRLCPCMLMSPISVAQYLDPNRAPFDLVVFDEASQLPTSKAIGALARGENAIVVGDPKQMPPTSFFASSATDEDHLDEEDMESILDDCLALNMPQTHLLWHYRSRHESLIAFSNSQFYENKLYTFPSANNRESRVRLIHVDGVFERGGKRVNRQEAEAVVAELKRRSRDPQCMDQSVGVVTFNISQQNLIDDLLTDACKEDPRLEEWAYSSKEPIFIKNLENAQGDERDVILFSIGYGPDSTGKVAMNFGPLNRDGGWRRLNVAVSRARCEMLVFATLTPDQINLSRTSAEGVAALKRFMEFAAGDQATKSGSAASLGAGATKGVVDAICAALRERGYETDRNIGASAYKIDIGVVNPKNSERYLLGVLTDGGSYETAQTTRDREIAQIGVLRGLGWRIVRVWSMDWWSNSEKEIERVMSEIRAAEEAEERERQKALEEPPVVAKVEESPSPAKEAEASAPTPAPDPAPAPKDEIKLKGVIEVDPQESRAVDVYRVKQLTVTPKTAAAFVDPSPANRRRIVERVMSVLEFEAPISETLLTRRVAQSFGISRAGTRIQTFMYELLQSLNLKKTLQDGYRIYWKDEQDPTTYSGFRANGEGEAKRDAKDVPVQEITNAVCRALEEQFSMREEDLVRAAANLMGITRVTAPVTALFSDAIARALQTGRIQKMDNGALMPKPK